MAINLRFGTLQLDQIAFGFSPAQEAVVSLHVLSDSSHHPLHIPWVIQSRKLLSPALKAELEAFQVLCQKRIVSLWEPEPGSRFPPFEDELAALLNMPIENYTREVSNILLGAPAAHENVLHDDKVRHEMVEKVIADYPLSISMIEELLDDPLRSRQHFCKCLAAYWEACLASEWSRLEDAFLHDIESRGYTLLQEGVLGLLSTLSPELHVNLRTGNGVRKSDVDITVEFNDKAILFLVPSYFVWPHILVKPDRPCELKYAIQAHWQQGKAPIPPERLLKLIRATGDMTRLQILQLLSQREHSTRELAGIIGVSEAAVSKQLRILQDVKLVKPRRESYYVFYSLVQNSLLDLTRGMMQLLTSAPDPPNPPIPGR
jgi:DNA-binding transcriptional ArsR family regulator